jgi:hypothetical protein
MQLQDKEHRYEVVVAFGHSKRHGACSCGWYGPPARTIEAAYEDWQRHERECAPPPLCPGCHVEVENEGDWCAYCRDVINGVV